MQKPLTNADSIHHYENFPVGSWLVPKKHRPVIHEIYRFARFADDIADEGSANAAQRVSSLEELRSLLFDSTAPMAIGNGGPSAVNITNDLKRRFALPQHRPIKDAIFFQLGLLLDAFVQDSKNTPPSGASPTLMFNDSAELKDYCSRSANPVGRMMLILFDCYDGKVETKLTEHSDAICTGLQWLNFLQDVASDAQRRRIYIPRSEIKTTAHHTAFNLHGVTPKIILEQTMQAKVLLASGGRLIGSVPLRLSLELRAIVAGGLSIADKIAAVGGNTVAARPTLSARDLLSLARYFITGGIIDA